MVWLPGTAIRLRWCRRKDDVTTQPISRDSRVSFAAFRARAAEGWQGRDEPLLRLGAALTLIASGVIHGAQITSHLGASRLAGLFFASLAALQVSLGVAMLTSASWHLRVVALVVTFGTIAVWIVSRTVGIPIGAEAREAVGVADAVATGFELVTAALVGALLLIAPRSVAHEGRTARSNAVGRYLTAVAMTLVIAAVTAVALRPVPLHAHQHARDETSPSVANDKLLDLLDHHGSHEADHPSP